MRIVSQCGSTYSCLSRSISEIQQPVAGTLRGETVVETKATLKVANT